MNGEKGSINIDVIQGSNTKRPQRGKILRWRHGGFFALKRWLWRVWEFCREDSNRVIFSLKVGLAVLLVSLLILLRAPYQVFGANIIWSLLTVAIMFEYTVGMRIVIYIHGIYGYTHLHAQLRHAAKWAGGLYSNKYIVDQLICDIVP